jgi:hypothetical protein
MTFNIKVTALFLVTIFAFVSFHAGFSVIFLHVPHLCPVFLLKWRNLSKLGIRSSFFVVFYISSQGIVTEEDIRQEGSEMMEEEAKKCKRMTERTWFDKTGVFPVGVAQGFGKSKAIKFSVADITRWASRPTGRLTSMSGTCRQVQPSCLLNLKVTKPARRHNLRCRLEIHCDYSSNF